MLQRKNDDYAQYMCTKWTETMVGGAKNPRSCSLLNTIGKIRYKIQTNCYWD